MLTKLIYMCCTYFIFNDKDNSINYEADLIMPAISSCKTNFINDVIVYGFNFIKQVLSNGIW